MQTIDAFLEQDIPLFLDTFEQNREKSEASEDEINNLLGQEYQKRVHQAKSLVLRSRAQRRPHQRKALQRRNLLLRGSLPILPPLLRSSLL